MQETRTRRKGCNKVSGVHGCAFSAQVIPSVTRDRARRYLDPKRDDFMQKLINSLITKRASAQPVQVSSSECFMAIILYGYIKL